MKMFLLGILIMYIIGWFCWEYENLFENANGHYTPLPVILYEWPIRLFLTIVISPVVFVYLKIKKVQKEIKKWI